MASETPVKIGRPKGSGSRYTEELAELICQVVEEGNGLATACRLVSRMLDDPINDSTVYGWKKDIPAFTERYARARQIQVERMADEILDIANGSMADEGVPTWDQLQRDRLKIDTRKFLLAKVLPKTFGDKLAVEQDTNLSITLVDETARPKADEKPEDDDED